MDGVASGYDLHAAAQLRIPPGARALVPTTSAPSLAALPPGTVGRVAYLSRLTSADDVQVCDTVVDATRPIAVALVNRGRGVLAVDYGDRIAQLLIERHVRCDGAP